MKKVLFGISTATLLLTSFITNSYAYNNTYVFGDSLSDGGNNGRYTTDGANSELYDEYVSHYITGKDDLRPSNKNGTNYAEGGATALPMPDHPYTTEDQLNNYLKQHGGKADPNGIYIHWVGGNDITTALKAYNFITGDSKQSHKIVDSSANATSNQINNLVKAGAGLIIVPTVPDVGTTPRMMEELITKGLTTLNKTPKQIKEILEKIHKEINKHDIPSGEAREMALNKLLEKLAKESRLPKDALASFYNTYRQKASELTDSYNQQVDDKISQSHGNILRADINALLHEVMENPYAYGIQNTLGYSCPQGIDANKCSSKDKNFDKDKEFLFSDGFHPTPYVHHVAGQYITSIYTAPFLVASLTSVNQLPVKGVRSFLDGHLQQLRDAGNTPGKIGVFGGYTHSGNDTFTLGSDYQLTDNLLLGALYSHYEDERTVASSFTYEGLGHTAIAYGLWNLYDNAWLSADLHYSHTNYDSLIRNIELGKATRREIGSTTGKQWGARITANWNIPVNEVITTSPIVQFVWDKGDVNGYREHANNSTSMHFSGQKYTSEVGTLGWRVDTQLGRFNPYAAIQFNRQFGDLSTKIRSAINATKTSFVIESNKRSKNWRQYTLGMNMGLVNNLHSFISVTRNEGSGEEPDYNINLGINAVF
ncbi:autotransporter outer membrane beta-barrel domain-containing protein [Xenorhabdus bharatensis]|uniref:autotransporter outer membrane beta-barrel domain-containing protein n=1 Tax=Xenorhabdus bharatensis TaxID=3136256 RepID=UPI0030F3E65C